MYIYGVTGTKGISKVQFPTWTVYGNQDDLASSWWNNSIVTGTNLGDGTWMYHVDIANHNNESGLYITHIYAITNIGAHKPLLGLSDIAIETSNYAGSLYLDNNTFDNNTTCTEFGTRGLYDNFTLEFDAQPTVTTPIYSLETYAPTVAGTHNFIIAPCIMSSPYAGIGLALGTNGAVAIAHSANYFYTLLTYSGDLSARHRYRFTVSNNVPKLYVDGKLVATGIKPLSPITTLYNYGSVLCGSYGQYTGKAYSFILYNNAR